MAPLKLSSEFLLELHLHNEGLQNVPDEVECDGPLRCPVLCELFPVETLKQLFNYSCFESLS